MAPSTFLNVIILLALHFQSLQVFGNFANDFEVTWSLDHAKTLNNGDDIQLVLDRSSGGAFSSKNDYLFGRFDMHIKLIQGNSAGTVTTFYLSSGGSNQDEIDLEFLGNISGDPIVLHTNIYTQGKGGREQQFYLWFDPTQDFHTYSILWNPQYIEIMVDETPIRVWNNRKDLGVAYPDEQRMKVQGSFWDGEDWATRGGLVKTDWNCAPFVAAYSTFNYEETSLEETLSPSEAKKLREVQRKYMIYNYCSDTKRFSQGLPLECTKPNL